MYRVIFALLVFLQFGCAAKLRPEEFFSYSNKAYESLNMQQTDSGRVELVISRIDVSKDRNVILVYNPDRTVKMEGLLLPSNSQALNESLRNRSWLLFDFRCGSRTCELAVRQKIRNVTDINNSSDVWIFSYSAPRILKDEKDKWLYHVLASQYQLHPSSR